MIRKFKYTAWILPVALVFFSGSAYAGTMILDSFTDQTTEPINLPATKLLVATIDTSATQGGNDATATSVSIGGTVVPADVAEVCVDYNTVEITCQANPNPLSNISLTLGGNQKGGSAFDYRVSLNPSAGGETIQVTVESITNTNLTDNIPLPQSTATRNVAVSVTVPTLSTPVLIGGLTTVTSSGATLGATQTGNGGGSVTARGIVWNTTGTPTTADNTAELQTGADLADEAFEGAVGSLTAGTQIFFRGYATNSAGDGYTAADGTVYTEPANQPTGLGFSAITATSMTVTWSDPGGATGAEGAIVVMKAGSDPSVGDEIPVDGNDDTSYTVSDVWGSAGAIGAGGAKVVFLGSGNSVNVTGLASSTTYYVRIYEYAGTGTGDTGINYLEETPLSGNDTTTALTVPVLSTPVLIGGLTTVTSTTATLGATQTGTGGATVTARGIVWNTTGSPTTADTTAELQTGDLANEAFSGLVGSPSPPLTSGSLIYFRGYATNSVGDGYTASDGTVYTEPANQPTGLGFSAITANSMTITWSDPGGATGAEGAIVVMKAGSDPNVGDEIPVDGNDDTSYTVSNVWGSAGAIGAGGAKVVFLGSGNSVNVIGLIADTFYHVRIYEYAGTGTGDTGINYLEEAPLSGNDTTTSAPVPTLSTPVLIGGLTTVTSSGATLGATQTGNGGTPVTARGIVWNTTGSPTTADNTAELQTGADLADEAFQGAVGSLTAGTQIFFRGYATNLTGDGYTVTDGTVYTEPANQPTGIGFSAVTASGMTITWSDPGGATGAEGAIVVMKPGSDPGVGDEIPVDGNDGTSYSPSNAWGSAGTIGAGGAKVVFLGSGNSVNVTGLTQDVTYHVRIYEYAGTGTGDTGINYLEETPLSGSQLTAAISDEPTVQASGVNVDVVASRSLRINWTAGNGDGSIVTLRLQATGEVPPVDFTDYAADSDYTLAPATSGGSENFVVYKGSGTNVTVSGLTQNITYTIAVYAWGAFGIETDYLLTITPGDNEVDQITDGPAMHNYDNVASCGDCHTNHGNQGFVPRGTNGEAVCRVCHQPGGTAELKLNFNMHNTPTYAADDVDCGSCHEMHWIKAGSANTTESTNPVGPVTAENLKFVRANVDKYISTATSDDAVYHSEDDKATEGGTSTTARGICQACHTDAANHNYDGTNTCHDGASDDSCGPAQVVCNDCHTHVGSFAPEGGSGCIGCHSSVKGARREIVSEFSRLSTHIADTSLTITDCEVCHKQTSASPSPTHDHKDGFVTLWDVDDHSDSGTTTQLGEDVDPAVTRSEAVKLDYFCLQCHDSDGAADENSSADNTPLSPFTDSIQPPDIAATWSSSSHGTMPQTGTGSGEITTCYGDSNFGCHASGHGSEKLTLLTPDPHLPATSPDFSEQREGFCLNCHTTNGASSKDIHQWLGGLSTDFTDNGNNGSGAPINQKHDILPADQTYSGGEVTCNDCHEPHTATTANPNIDPDTGSMFTNSYSKGNSYTDDGYNWTYDSTGSNLDPTDPIGGLSYSEPDYIEFCLTCHDGTTPPGVTMSSGMINIATSYQVDYHGRGDAGSAGNGDFKVPWVATLGDEPGTPYAAINCTLCHTSHGSGNIYHLRESITIGNSPAQEVGGWTGDTIGTLSGTTYTLPLTGGVQVDHDWGGWCSFCHDMQAHKVDEDKACRSGHMHGGGAF